MLNKIKNELRMTVVYNIIFVLFAAIASNNGIDKYLFEEFIETFIEAIPWLLLISVTYIVLVYVFRAVSKAVKNDVTKIKEELNKKKIEA